MLFSLKKIFTFLLMAIMIGGYVFAKENLAILPFTGGQNEEGETIAELFSFDARLNDFFNPIPRTSITRAINRERGFQMDSGMTDPNTVISIANEVGARYVVAGSITSVGRNNLLVIAIMDVKNLQQIAGDYQTYTAGRIEELRGKLPSMASNIIQATQKKNASLPKLAIVPIQLRDGADQRVADTLAQLLAIHLIRSGKYTVYPRTQSLDQVFDEHMAQMSGHTADNNIIGIGKGDNPDYVLTVAARRLGNSNMFNAAIINLETRIQVVGRTVDYQDINDGMRAMEALANDLTSTTEQITQRRNDEEERKHRAEAKDSFLKNTEIALGFRAGISQPFYTDNNYNIDGMKPLINTPLAIIVGVNFGSFFSIQSGFQYSLWDYSLRYTVEYNYYGGVDYYYYDVDFNIIQIPLLAKFNLSAGNFIFSPFAGIGFNIPISSDAEEADTISLPVNGIIGINMGIKTGKIIFFTDIRYNADFEERKLKFSNNSYKMNTVDITFGVEFLIPLK
jgi:TolB-like protein